jgi:simple sugar transport system ATP-binding protein
MKTYGRFTRNGFLDKKRIETRANSIISDYQVATPSPETAIANLSGGNIQKFIIGRELCDNPSLIIASHPTYGVDIGATEFIRQQLLRRRSQGAAILLVSEDLEELLQLCDRIAVMFRGRFMDVFANGTVSLERIGLLMTGVA